MARVQDSAAESGPGMPGVTAAAVARSWAVASDQHFGSCISEATDLCLYFGTSMTQ